MKRVDFDPQRRAQSAEPRQERLRAHQLGRGAGHRRQRDPAPEARARPGLDDASRTARTISGATSATTSASLLRFGNLIGFTRVAANPDSWEGWYWGAMHHWGHSQRVGVAGNYGTVEDCLQEAEHDRVLVQRSGKHRRRLHGLRGHAAAPVGEASSASSSSTSTRTATRQRSCSAGAGSRSARAPTRRWRSAIMYVWITEGLYDQRVRRRAHHGLRGVARLPAGRRRRRAEDAGVAGGRKPACRRKRRARAGAPVGAQEDLSRRRRCRHRLRRRRPRRHRRAVGALHGHDDGACRAWASPASTWAT